MGSQIMQGKFWGQRPKDWSEIQEPTGKAGYDFVLNYIEAGSANKLLDVGCGSGYFCKLAVDKGFDVTGLDATPELIAEAKKRASGKNFIVGEMEQLPFEENYFDIVCGFNSFQYATDIKNALKEAKRVLKDGGKLSVMIWGNKEDCEAATYLKAVGSLLPPPAPGAGGPFAFSENQLLENILGEVGFKILSNQDVISVWDYANIETALKGLMSAGPVSRAIEHCGFQKVHETLLQAVQPFVQANGHIVYHNKFRIVIAEK